MTRKGRRITKKLLSYMLIASGAFLLFQGARQWIESQWGQKLAERRFEKRFEKRAPQPLQIPSVPKMGDTVARLTIPRLDTQLYVVEGVDQVDLRRGPGHMPGTAMPGSKGNCVIAAHRDLHFRVLKDIRKGDDIVLETQNGEFLYRVKSTRIVSPNNTSVLDPSSGHVLNLITCYPFYYVGHAPKRYIVEAEMAGSIKTSSLPPS